MQHHKFGKKSREKLESAHMDLRAIMAESLRVSMIDFGVSEGHRSTARQNELFKQGLTKIDGISKKGKHNHSPSLAVDIYGYVNGKISYKMEHLSYLGGVITSTAERLFQEGRIDERIRWGGNWDRDGEIITDQKFDDLVHFELDK